MKPENKAEVKTPKEFYTEKAVYHVDGYEYNVDEPELVKAFHLFAEQQIGVYKSDLVKRIEERIHSLESEMQNFDTQAERAKIRAWRRMIIENEKVLSIITKEQ